MRETMSFIKLKRSSADNSFSNPFILSTKQQIILSESVSPHSTSLYLESSGQLKIVPLCIKVHVRPNLSFFANGWQLVLSIFPIVANLICARMFFPRIPEESISFKRSLLLAFTGSLTRHERFSSRMLKPQPCGCSSQ